MTQQTARAAHYMFDSDTDLGGRQLALLEELLDETTFRFLDGVPLAPGQRALDLGAGGGSVTRGLAARVGPDGRVVAVDLATDRLRDLPPAVEVHRHDVRDGLPAPGPYHLIHARLLLMHLPQRRALVRMLAQALAPGGHLVLGEMGARPNRVLAAPRAEDRALFERVQHVAHTVLTPARGVSWEWAHEADGALAEAGLVEVYSEEFSRTGEGGTPACRLHRNYVLQATPLLLAEGLTQEELDRYGELMLDPGFRAWFYQFVLVRGRRAA
ncbi:class I SAM-dependent methyltransferase [Streptomyces sp. TRM66268-LWL]|uniref:Class I SAM-dependent methyltransferase n=1 Tax=Streptomyces polyasparticus TaxID=2767826 RepID=A0ABR7SGQ3_9ACTN|nr:class I SAM-dependent methyltransferase [Streptomyces polyasparticus]MBC9714394.1 class I SAM-dependent methyltransferase [Streptomyces polyasparticus]